MSAQIQKGETFTDVAPGKTVTSTRLNKHVDSAVVLKGAVTEQTTVAANITATDDTIIFADTSDSAHAYPKQVTLANLLPQTVRQQVPVYAAGTLSGGVYAVTLSPAASAYTEGMVVRFKADSANVGAVDINVNAIGAKNLFTRAGAELAANDILASSIVEAVYDGTQFIVINCISAAQITATHLREANRQSVHQYAAGALTAGVYVVTLSPAATAYTSGMVVRFTADAANTGAVDINVNGLGAKNLFNRSGFELAANAIRANQIVECVYDGTAFQVASVSACWDYTSSNTAFPGTTAAATFAHGLGVIPQRIRVVAVQTNAAAQHGYAQNEEVSVESLQKGGSGESAFAVSADATNVTVAQVDSANVDIIPKAGGAYTGMTEANWNLKVYASI